MKMNADDVSASDGESTETKVCTQCYRMLPLIWFRFKKKEAGLRHSACRDCRNAHNAQKLSAGKRRALSKHITALRRTRSLRQFDATFAVVVREFGGVEALGKFWAQTMKDAATYSRGGAARAATVFVEVKMRADRLRPKIDVSDLSDEDLQAVLSENLRGVLDEDCGDQD